jgi:hypothetical protein
MAGPSISTSARTIDDWMTVLDPLGYWQAADIILNDLRDYPKGGKHREGDKSNWAMPWSPGPCSQQVRSRASWAGRQTGHQHRGTVTYCYRRSTNSANGWAHERGAAHCLSRDRRHHPVVASTANIRTAMGAGGQASVAQRIVGAGGVLLPAKVQGGLRG